MILQALTGYYERLAELGKLPEIGWCQAKVSYAVNLSKEGEVKGILSLKQEKKIGNKLVLQPSSMKVPQMVTRSSGVLANFLCDNSKYLMGIDTDGSSQRVMECFLAAKEKHLALLKNVPGEMANAVRLYFEKWNPECAKENEDINENWDELTAGGNLIFCMGIYNAQDDEEIKAAWNSEIEKSESGQEGICLVTGKRTEIARIHRAIKGVPGAQSSGAALVSFNAPAFESYGKEQSYNAPVGTYAEFAYTTALNYLLEQRKYTFQLGDTMIVCWAENGEETYQDTFFMSVNPAPDNQETVRGIFENLEKGNYVDVDGVKLNPNQKFYIMGLAPNAARLSVRFFYQDSFGNILRHLSEHYKRMELVKPSWEENSYLGVKDMLFATVNQKSKDKTPIPNMSAMVLRSILTGTGYPAGVYFDTLIRIRSEQGKSKVTWQRISIVKAYLIQNYHWERGEKDVGLNEQSDEKAYILGRLFAVLEDIQLRANPGINMTIKERYFNSACATPANVFPVLLKLKNSHIKKIEREQGSAKIYYEKSITELIGKIDDFPKRMSLEEQGKFAIGYYHQVQKKYEKREDK